TNSFWVKNQSSDFVFYLFSNLRFTSFDDFKTYRFKFFVKDFFLLFCNRIGENNFTQTHFRNRNLYLIKNLPYNHYTTVANHIFDFKVVYFGHVSILYFLYAKVMIPNQKFINQLNHSFSKKKLCYVKEQNFFVILKRKT